MEWFGRGRSAFLACFLLVGLISQNVVMSRSLQEFTEQKNYYTPTTGSTPRHSHKTNCPPSSGGSCAPAHGGSYGTPTPSPGGGSYGTTPSTPSVGGGYSSPSSPSTPTFPTPSTPTDPHIPHFFTGTCRFWGSHPDVIAAIMGSLSTIGDLFGHGCAAIFGSNPTLPDALNNARPDGYGALFREGAAALLNSMVNSRYPFTTPQVKSAFAGAITSVGAAAAQADIFKQANEGKFKP